MAFTRLGDAVRRLVVRVTGSAVQDCPPEMAACEVCRRSHCTDHAWLTCDRRIAAQRLLEAGNRAAFEEFRRGHDRAAAGACVVDEGG